MKEYFLWLLKTVSLLIIILVVIPVLLAFGIAGMSEGLSEKRIGQIEKAVAVVELTGIIDNSKEVLSELHRHVKDETVEGVVLRINSPGGAVGPAQEIFETINQLKSVKPIVASMDGVAASGGLYAALAASKIYSNPGTITGSIGVIMEIPNLSKLASWAGVEIVTIKSGELKDVGNSFREMQPEERYFLEQTALRQKGAGLPSATKRAELAAVAATPQEVLHCPSRRPAVATAVKQHWRPPNANFMANVAKSDYAASMGDCDFPDTGDPGGYSSGDRDAWWADFRQQSRVAKLTGVVAWGVILTPAHVRDGLSNTYLIGEKAMNPDAYGGVGYGATYELGDNEVAYSGFNRDICRSAHWQPLRDTGGINTGVNFGSNHAAAFGMCLADGSVRWLTYELDPDLHRRLAVRDDGEVISAPGW